MADDFGALTDHFGFLALVSTVAGTLADSLELVDSSKDPVAKSRADATDENGDIAASSFYGDASETLFTASSTFALSKTHLDTEDMKLGQLATGKIVTGIELSTGADGWPQIVVSGELGALVLDTSILQTFLFPAYDLEPRKQAQLIGFTVGVGCKLTGSSMSASIDIANQADGLGEPVAHGISGGTQEMSADFVRITAAPSWTVDGTGLTETKAPGASEGQAAYHTGTGTAAGTITRETA